jgi:hypothetical protein
MEPDQRDPHGANRLTHECVCNGAGWDGCEPTLARVPIDQPDRGGDAALTATAALLMLEWPEPVSLMSRTAALTADTVDDPSIAATTRAIPKREEASHGYL